MLKILRTYRVFAALTAFALVGSAFAPLSAACAMDPAEVMGGLEDSRAQPCHEMGEMGMNGSAPEEDGDAINLAGPSNVMTGLACCEIQATPAPESARKVVPTAQVIEPCPVVVASPFAEIYRTFAADESPPRKPVALHLLFGCFLT